VPAARLIKLPNGVSCDAAAAMLLKGLTVQYLFRQTYKLSRGETILFHAAAGGVGLIACQWARHLGVTMIGTVSSAEKAKLAKARGCDHIIDYTTEDVAARVAALTMRSTTSAEASRKQARKSSKSQNSRAPQVASKSVPASRGCRKRLRATTFGHRCLEPHIRLAHQPPRLIHCTPGLRLSNFANPGHLLRA
jgi:D-arabinose 1-dehydrogenase-like Zn-dependent alcohol dehydrogenase